LGSVIEHVGIYGLFCVLFIEKNNSVQTITYMYCLVTSLDNFHYNLMSLYIQWYFLNTQIMTHAVFSSLLFRCVFWVWQFLICIFHLFIYYKLLLFELSPDHLIHARSSTWIQLLLFSRTYTLNTVLLRLLHNFHYLLFCEQSPYGIILSRYFTG
jgi:hypothetical protein